MRSRAWTSEWSRRDSSPRRTLLTRAHRSQGIMEIRVLTFLETRCRKANTIIITAHRQWAGTMQMWWGIIQRLGVEGDTGSSCCVLSRSHRSGSGIFAASNTMPLFVSGYFQVAKLRIQNLVAREIPRPGPFQEQTGDQDGGLMLGTGRRTRSTRRSRLSLTSRPNTVKGQAADAKVGDMLEHLTDPQTRGSDDMTCSVNGSITSSHLVTSAPALNSSFQMDLRLPAFTIRLRWTFT
ncbi:hypothetical protein J6590_066256 [Homalodisca vitripennis]|nr:hypothetical protein J6590_066256 [Homalodisca vitripennis]